MIPDMITNKTLIQKEKFILFLPQNLISNYQKILDETVHIFLLRKFPTNERLNKSHLIIYQILTLKNLCIFTKKYTAKPCSF